MKRSSLVCLAALVFTLGCGGPPQAVVADDAQPHLGETWFARRAETLAITVDAARTRDAALPGSEGPPPEAALDDFTAREAAVVWRTQCAACHGLDGQPPAAVVERYEAIGQKPPRAWGGMAAMGFMMGGDAMRAKLYTRIADGIPPAMPAWGGVLSREQIWALVRHIEGF